MMLRYSFGLEDAAKAVEEPFPKRWTKDLEPPTLPAENAI